MATPSGLRRRLKILLKQLTRNLMSRFGFCRYILNRKMRKCVLVILTVLSLFAVLLASPFAEFNKRNDENRVPITLRQKSALDESRVTRNLTRMPRGHMGTKTRSGGAEKHHVFFLKVHKAASTTVQNVLLRFALSRRLKVQLPKSGHMLSQSSKNWLVRALPLPPGVSAFDILCNHIVFDEQSVRARLYPDSVFIGIVRQPFSQFVSAFKYYRDRYRLEYLRKLPDAYPISEYLKNPGSWEPYDPGTSYTNNRMSFDFGIDPLRMRDQAYVADYVMYLNKTFHLVLVSERFDESMILMRRYLGWKMKDVLYVKNNVYKSKTGGFTVEQKLAHMRYNMADYALYEHFSNLFDKRVAAEGEEFREEVKVYVSVRNRVETFCRDHSNETDVSVTATVWNEKFQVSKTDCIFMRMTEESLVDSVRLQIL